MKCALADLLVGKRLLVFDFDGTLADTSTLHAAAFNFALAGRGIVVDYERIAGLRTEDALAQVLEAHGEPFEQQDLRALAATKKARVRTLITQDLRPFPGVTAFLSWARPRFRLAVFSSGSRATVETAMAALGFGRWFDPVICGDDVSRAKPDPEGYRLALRSCGVAPSEALVFEDSEAGLVSAINAQCQVVGIFNESVRERALAHGTWIPSWDALSPWIGALRDCQAHHEPRELPERNEETVR